MRIIDDVWDLKPDPNFDVEKFRAEFNEMHEKICCRDEALAYLEELIEDPQYPNSKVVIKDEGDEERISLVGKIGGEEIIFGGVRIDKTTNKVIKPFEKYHTSNAKIYDEFKHC